MSMRPVDRVLLAWLVYRRFGKRRVAVKEKPKREIRIEPKKKRRLWVHPNISHRISGGHFHTLYSDLREDPERFFSFCRFSIQTFDKLLEELRPGLTFQNTNMRRCITPEERLIVTLRFLATGDSFTSLHFEFLVGTSTIAGIVRSTCEIIWERLKATVMPKPTAQQWMEIADGFYSAAEFPNCVGALDGKHIRVKKPPHSGPNQQKFRQWSSLVLLGIADHNHRFVTIDIGSYGCASDAFNFRAFRTGQRIITEQLDIPGPRKLPGSSGPPAPFVIVADKNFSLSTNVMRPFPRRGLDERKRIFNGRLAKTHQFVQSAFEMLVNKWRIFMSPIQMDPANVNTVLKACVILHNYSRIYDSDLDLEAAGGNAASPALDQAPPARPGTSGLRIRDMYTEYFLTPEGAVPWQEEHAQ
ncbi:uncharacterized protein [Engystomops pustulosus]|uniref:uncharacterized protein n=1 Tax=Engystomops pustulosus TaxID=76066 RepID=UPI003AFA5D50